MFGKKIKKYVLKKYLFYVYVLKKYLFYAYVLKKYLFYIYVLKKYDMIKHNRFIYKKVSSLPQKFSFKIFFYSSKKREYSNISMSRTK